jgi:hypothetical protein
MRVCVAAWLGVLIAHPQQQLADNPGLGRPHGGAFLTIDSTNLDADPQRLGGIHQPLQDSETGPDTART